MPKTVSALTNYNYGVVQSILRTSNRDDPDSIFSMNFAWFRIWVNDRYKLGLFSPRMNWKLF